MRLYDNQRRSCLPNSEHGHDVVGVMGHEERHNLTQLAMQALCLQPVRHEVDSAGDLAVGYNLPLVDDRIGLRRITGNFLNHLMHKPSLTSFRWREVALQNADGQFTECNIQSTQHCFNHLRALRIDEKMATRECLHTIQSTCRLLPPRPQLVQRESGVLPAAECRDLQRQRRPALLRGVGTIETEVGPESWQHGLEKGRICCQMLRQEPKGPHRLDELRVAKLIQMPPSR
mmetsp:Transcript_43686/g.109677  ORF Transcript_43686/g.109677 Transcript_43686/m.109677 type:complete len:231 (-) Transcript_43686:497-1189(-)